VLSRATSDTGTTRWSSLEEMDQEPEKEDVQAV
jgi:hypothetical protein